MTDLIGRSPDQPGTSSFASAKWGRSHKDAWAGCTVSTFLPCFLFIFFLAPYIELLANDRRLKAVLIGVTAAVLGVVANLAVYFATQVLFPDGVLDHKSPLWVRYDFRCKAAAQCNPRSLPLRNPARECRWLVSRLVHLSRIRLRYREFSADRRVYC